MNWELRRGTMNAVIGPNGSGKSTLARLLAGEIWPTDGAAELYNCNGFVPAGTLRGTVRVVQPAAPLDFDAALTVRDIVLTGFFGTLGLYDRPTASMQRRAGSLIRAIGLEEVADSEYGFLSTGEKVRALIARALAVRPKLLILDEPTNGLDLLAREQVLMTLARLMRTTRDTTVLMITHHIAELPPGTKQILVLAKGRVQAGGSPADTLRADILSRAYGVKVEVHHQHGRYYATVHPKAWQMLG